TAVDYIIEQKGKHFDPELVDVFIKNIDEAHAIRQSLADVK
ncbi:MAG: hypothetical protein JWQ21_3836, partial [Herminiimonas sp.]|nr:hypothetical protein [Herminiimonas sp.]